MNDIKYFIGPMSKNIVDAIIEFCDQKQTNIGLIPSRRQIEFNGGYSNNWTTELFSKYVKSKTNKILLERDHSGPNQGNLNDDGYESLKNDCQYLDIIHIDPWKKYNDYTEGFLHTLSMINFCFELNPNILYEIGTEESIRKFSEKELNKLLSDLKLNLNDEVFNKIKYVVIQSGTSLKGNNQTGNYDKNRLENMIDICKKYNKFSKEHNGDYIEIDIIKEKFKLGLDSINIAPEFGLIETNSYLSYINSELIDTYWKICYNSKKWVKWVDNNFDPFKNKIELIKICGHYILSNDDFLTKVKLNMSVDIDSIIKLNIKNKLEELYQI